MAAATYTGCCHCGAVRFRVELDLASGTKKCNCSLCAKLRFWSVQLEPKDFRLLSGEHTLAEYRGGNAVAHHYFCAACGVHTHQFIDLPNLSDAQYINVNLLCINGISAADLGGAPVTYQDGLNDAWERCPAETGHL